MTDDPRDLVPLYTDDTTIRIRRVGGPEDGQTLTWDTPGGRLPPVVYLPVDPGLPSLCDYDLAPVTNPSLSLRVAVYRPQLDEYGLPSRDDAGVYRYEYRGER